MKGPREIGPYRIEERLGVGGMGEVWRAWDERLERSVAVKLIHPQAAEDGIARERFRREARAAAALSHPAIVQIHDLVSSDEGEALVMELVEGEPLSRRIADGPLPIAEAVRLGKEIAEGLAAAHARGLLHRDLKTENVMVTSDGHAKILDFGLAKRLDSEASLTRSAVVVGTFRSMSPEQARGLPLDLRSDLFSLGVLLYEILTGQSPFRGTSAPDTLTRICTARQTPVREVRPEVPAALSGLVDRLLEKDPDVRPQSANEVAAALAGLTGPTGPASRSLDEEATRVEGEAHPVAGTARFRGDRLAVWKRKWVVAAMVLAVLAGGLAVLVLRRPPEPLQVAVVRPEIPAGGDVPGVDLQAFGLRIALLRGLLSLEGVVPLAPEQVDLAAGPPVQVARVTAADEVVTSRMSCRGETCEIALSRVRGADGSLVWTQSFAAPIGKPYLLAEAVEGHLKNGYAGRPIRPEISRLEVRPGDYAEYLRLRDERASRKAGLSDDQALSRLDAIHAGSPRFLEAYVLEAEILRQRFIDRRDRADLDRALGALAHARELAPFDPRPWFAQFEVALRGERLDLAEEAVTRLERLQPGDPGILTLRARLLERQGDEGRALALMREAARRLPSLGHLVRLADLEYRLGESSAARGHLEEVLRRSPGHHAAQSLLAQIELQYGSPRRAAELYVDLVRRTPRPAELINLGTAQMLLARYTDAEATLRRSRRIEPDNPFAVLSLADACLLGGKRAEAQALYRELLGLVAQDPAAANWQLVSVRAQALAHLGERRAAVEAAQRMLRLAQGNSQAALEAAQVYALVGDQTSALVHAEAALDKGVDPRWFTFPWFDPLRRAAPEFRELLARQTSH